MEKKKKKNRTKWDRIQNRYWKSNDVVKRFLFYYYFFLSKEKLESGCEMGQNLDDHYNSALDERNQFLHYFISLYCQREVMILRFISFCNDPASCALVNFYNA
mgnify:CR=1 FL=1